MSAFTRNFVCTPAREPLDASGVMLGQMAPAVRAHEDGKSLGGLPG
jgi:hypothetical protein